MVQVPRADMYTAEQSVLAESMTAIKAAWHCDEHGTCFIDGKCDHIEVNRFHLKVWASTVVSMFSFRILTSILIKFYSKLVIALLLIHHLQNFYPSGLASRLTCPQQKLAAARVLTLQLLTLAPHPQTTQVCSCRHFLCIQHVCFCLAFLFAGCP